MATFIKSRMWLLTWRDALMGLFNAMVGAALTIVYTSIDAGVWAFDWTAVWHGAVLAGIAHILRKWLTTSDGRFLGIGKKQNATH